MYIGRKEEEEEKRRRKGAKEREDRRARSDGREGRGMMVEKERRIRVCKGEIIKKIGKQRRGGVPRAKMAVLLAARRQELLINAKKTRGARWEGVGRYRQGSHHDASRFLQASPPSTLPFLPPTAHRCGFRIKSKIPIGDAPCRRSTLYIRGTLSSSVRIDQARRLVSPRLATPIIISLERAASLRRLYRNGVDVCFVCTSPSGVLQRVGISKQEVGTFVITRDRVPARRETAESR